jgi:hypothetical protein
MLLFNVVWSEQTKTGPREKQRSYPATPEVGTIVTAGSMPVWGACQDLV